MEFKWGDIMYVDLDIPINEKLPERVKESMRILERAYVENDVGTYMLNLDSVEVDLRECLRAKILSPDEFKVMYSKFGWG